MSFVNPYSPYLFVSFVIAFVAAMFTWQRRSAPGAFPLLILLITSAVWAGANGLVLEAKDTNWQVFWFNVLTVGAMLGNPAFWAFGVQFTNHAHWLTKRNILLICLVPILSILLTWTTEYHHLFYTVRDFTNKLPNGDWKFIPGPFYWIYIIYSYSIALFTFSLILRIFIQSPPMYRWQTSTVLVGTLVPLVGNIAYSFFWGVGKGENIDPTPLLFTIMGIFYVFGIFWFQLFEVIPIARHTLVEYMQDGVIVVDVKDRVVDINSSASQLLYWQESSPIGMNIHELLKPWIENFPDFPTDLFIETEIHPSPGPDSFFSLRIEPLMNKNEKLTGRLIILRDITRQKMAEKALRDAHDRLRLHLHEIEILHEELREQVIRDPLTGLFNRRYMEETFERELARAIREGGTIGICMADIDDFKSFNDRHGHKAGDLILQSLANIFITYSRAEDVTCRYGGEEFLILMPGADMDVTSRRAEDWRRAFEQTVVEFEGKTLSTTLSLGIAVFPQQGRTSDELIRLTDEALYLSKHSGKNQVSVARALGSSK